LVIDDDDDDDDDEEEEEELFPVYTIYNIPYTI
jgi:hypothetical protein